MVDGEKCDMMDFYHTFWAERDWIFTTRFGQNKSVTGFSKSVTGFLPHVLGRA